MREISYNARHHAMIIFCSKVDIDLWNEWRESHRKDEILLEGANLQNADLRNANLQHAHLSNANLKKAHLRYANLQNADLSSANLQHADLSNANMHNAHLTNANLQYADLFAAKLRNANLFRSKMQRANLFCANLQNAHLSAAQLQNACLGDTKMQMADLVGTYLQNTDATYSMVDGSTLLFGCKIDKNTDFSGVGLGDARIEPRLRVALGNNIRRIQWQSWIKEGPFWKKTLKFLLVKPFWHISDYGGSTFRIAIWFLILSIGFAALYYGFGLYDYYYKGTAYNPGIVNGLFPWKFHPDYLHPNLILRSLYFSFVTMTTLGFGDMLANEHHWLGHLLLMCQIIIGYILFGAMVTRFAVLFSSTGPAQTFERKAHHKR